MRGSSLEKRFIVLIAIFLVCFSTLSYAHPGRTDSNGGHKDNKNKSGLGSYHYHCGGYEAHLHPNGYCPYSSNSKSPTVDYSNDFVEESTPIVDIEEKIVEEQVIENKAEDIFEKEENFVQEVIENKEEPIKKEVIENEEVAINEEVTENKEEIAENKEVTTKEEVIEKNEIPTKEEVIHNNKEQEKQEVEKSEGNELSNEKEVDIEKTEDNIVISDELMYKEEAISNQEVIIDETEDTSSSGGIGTVLLLGGAGYLVYKKVSD